MRFPGRLFRALLLAILAAGVAAVRAQDPASGSAGLTEEELEWPRVVEEGDTTFTVYQPQVDVFENARLEARAAVEVERAVGDKTEKTYGVLWITADTFIDKEKRVVELTNIQVARANFPTAGDRTAAYLEVFRRNTESTRTVSLDRVEANLAITQADKKGNAVPLKNDPPRIYYRSTPAVLVLIDGEPALRSMEGTQGIERVINTKALILRTGGTFYMPIADRWLTARSATGPWQLSTSAPPPIQSIRDSIAKDEKQSQVDLMEDTSDDVEGVLKEGKSPEVIVSTVPAEIIATQGKPQMKPVTSTNLLYVTNTSGDILFDLQDQKYYVPLTGRWFRAKSLDGPWQFVEGDDLPADFAKIPTSDPKSSVLATVPGTPAAQEAVIANSIPQTAEVNRSEAKYESQYDGDPRFDAVPDTPIQYAVNSPTPVIRVNPTSYYAVQSGVWFSSATAMGPWIVATSVPPVIYTIPTASPIHYVTYVRVYRYTPTVVWVGYTPGYLGTCYSPWGTVVYGTGWYYRPWIGHYWYGAPWTWGFGAGFYWSTWGGWGWSFGWGGYRPYYNPWWGPYYGWRYRPPVYRPPYYGPRPTPYRPPYNWNNVNVYNRPGAPRPGVRPSARPAVRPVAPARPGQPATRPVQPAPRPGQPSTRPDQPSTRPGQPSTQPAQPSVQPARPSTRPVTRPSKPDNVYAGPDGKVYRPQPGRPGNWETNDGGTWKPVEPSQPSTRPAQPSRPSTRPAPEQPSTRPAPEQPAARPAPSRPTTDANTLNQLSRDQRARSAADNRMKPPPAPAPAPRSQPKQPAPKQPPPKKP